MTRIGTVAALWRYPVKSMAGESLTQLTLEAAGVEGDRRFAFESSNAPSGKPLLASRERTMMLRYQASLSHGTMPFITTPAALRLPLNSPELPVQLAADLDSEATSPIFLQNAMSATSNEKAAPDVVLRTSSGKPLTDVRPVSLISSATLALLSAELGGSLDPQRFRSNFIVELDHPSFAAPFAEDQLAGEVLQLGDGEGNAVLAVKERIPRCRIVSLDPTTTASDPSILRHLARYHSGCAGIYATVRSPGKVFIGSEVCLL